MEKAVSMVRVSKASNEQIKAMAVNGIRSGENLKRNSSRQVRPGGGSQQGKCGFFGCCPMCLLPAARASEKKAGSGQESNTGNG